MPILHWLDRDKHVRAAESVPYRLLEADDTHSGGDPTSPNMLIQGDNLDALKALLPFYAGRVKCIYVDPPFNTGQAFEHYDDNIEHSIWMGIMFPRLAMLHHLLSEDGTIAVHLDAEELPYCIVIMDEIFGRKNRIGICTFKQGSAVGHKAINPGMVTIANYLILYAKSKELAWRPNRVFTKRDRDKRYANYIVNYDENYSKWRLISLSDAIGECFGESARKMQSRLGAEDYELLVSRFVIENAHRVVQPVTPAYNDVGEDVRKAIDCSKSNPQNVHLHRREEFSDMYFRDGKRWLFYRDKMKDIDGEMVAAEPLTNIWDDLLSNNLHNEGGVTFPKGKKPEALVKRVFELFSHENDLVLDSFLGSGTTAAVAHKMGRRWIGIEMGDHAVTHCVPRLRKVIDGEQGGISQSVGWQGGGGFRFYRLGEPVFGADGRLNPAIRFATLAAHVWFAETGTALRTPATSPRLGIHDGTAIDLLYNGILGDRRPGGGNVLTSKILAALPPHDGPRIIYGEATRITTARLKQLDITFRQTPYDLKTR